MRTRQRNLGNRCLCSGCGTKYYDLGKPHPSCPRCSAPAHDDDDDPRAVAMARIKEEGPRKRSDDEELPFGLGKSDDTEEAEEEEEEELEELGDLTEEAADDNDDDFD